MKRISAMLALAFLLSACQAVPSSQGNAAITPAAESGAAGVYRKITAQEAYDMMTNQAVTVVDVRTAQEYGEGHIANAILVPNETIGEETKAVLQDLDATLLVYCRSGRRSKEASEKLLALGYSNVCDFGGIIDWPYDVVQE